MNLPPQRRAGVCLHLTSLPGPYGIGEIGQAAFDFIDQMTSMNLHVWQFLPTGPTAYGDSPYQPLSIFAGNELLVDIESLIQLDLLKPDEVKPLCDMPANTVDYGSVIPLKTALLTMAADRFFKTAGAGLKTKFEQYLDDNDARWLHNYALYRVLKTRHGEKPWSAWDPRFRHRDAAAMAQLETDASQQIANIKVLQFLFCQQWDALHAYAGENNIQLFGDMSICIALDSADAWSNPEILCIDREGRADNVAGVPPDYFSKDGQLWGNPLYDWSHHAANGYAWWVERLRHSNAMNDMVRIDHFRGFESFWSVPAEAKTARHGSWEPGPGEAIFEAMRNALGRLPIVAEDLGVITPAVESLRDHYDIPGMRVLQFDVTEKDFDISTITENCICYTGTHDNDTTIGWFHGSPDDTRPAEEIAATQTAVLKLTDGQAESVHNDMIRLAFGSNARVAIAPMQDFLGLGSEARLNTPGTSGNNWRWRLLPGQITPAISDSVGDMAPSTGRNGATTDP